MEAALTGLWDPLLLLPALIEKRLANILTHCSIIWYFTWENHQPGGGVSCLDNIAHISQVTQHVQCNVYYGGTCLSGSTDVYGSLL